MCNSTDLMEAGDPQRSNSASAEGVNAAGRRANSATRGTDVPAWGPGALAEVEGPGAPAPARRTASHRGGSVPHSGEGGDPAARPGAAQGALGSHAFPALEASLRGKGVLVVSPRLSVARAIVEALGEEGAQVLVASAHAGDLTQVLVGVKNRPMAVHGMTVDLARQAELERVFRWVDGMLPRLEVLVSIVEQGPSLSGNGAREDEGEDGVEAWRRTLEQHCVMPLLVVKQAAARMQLRGSGHILQVALHHSRQQPSQSGQASGATVPRHVSNQHAQHARASGALHGANGRHLRGYGVVNHGEREHVEVEGSSAKAGGVESTDAEGNDLVWRTLQEMMEARRPALWSAGVSLTLLDVDGCGSGAQTWGPSARGGELRPEDVAAAVQFCLHQVPRCVVENLRLGASCPVQGA